MKINRQLATGIVAILAMTAQVEVNANEILEASGLGQIHGIIDNDVNLAKRVPTEHFALAHQSIHEMNNLIYEAIKVNGLANDGFVSIADTKEINHYLATQKGDIWYRLRGVRNDPNSTGYYTVDRKGANTIVMSFNAVSSWGQIYNLGFPAHDKRSKSLSDYLGNRAGSFSTVGYELGEIIQRDIKTGQLYNPDYQEVQGTTDTALDQLVSAIMTDEGLMRKISMGDIRAGSTAADRMNRIILEAIFAEGLANDGKLTTADVRQMNHYIVANHSDVWSELHGDDENDEETGFHLVQNDGAFARMFADNVVNTIADGIYHLGFASKFRDNLANEDGNRNQRYEKVAWWLNTLLKTELVNGVLANPDYHEVTGTTGTTLDMIVSYIYNDEGLLHKISMADIRAGASSANAMNELIIEAIRATRVASDKYISADEVGIINQYLVNNYAIRWAELHGDDETEEETGYHLVQNDGARGVSYGRNIINQWADSVYHLGFATPHKNRLVNEDGNKNATFRNVAYWLNRALQDDYMRGIL